MAKEGYQGYENWETWNVSLQLSNDEGLYNTTIDIMKDNPPRYSEPAKAYFADEASEELKDFYEELLSQKNSSGLDTLTISRVRWQEVLEGFVSEGLVYTPIWQKWAKQVEKNPDGNYALWES